MEIVLLISISLMSGSMIGLVVATEREMKEIKQMRKVYEKWLELDETVLKKLAEMKSRS
jgi:hypothetical protein